MPIEARLSAYMDGEASREEKEELERLIASDAETRRLYETLRHGSDLGRKAFDDVLKEPVPLALVRSIKSAQPPKIREPARFTRPALKLAPTGRQALAAALILFFIGGGIGYLIGIEPRSAPAVLAAPPAARSWIDDVMAAHRVYTHQPNHLVEIPATRTDEIMQWLTAGVGTKFSLPDMASDGLVFEGARLVVAAGKPAGQLAYKNGDGDIVTITFLKDKGNGDIDEFNEVIKDDIAVVSWHRNDIGYAVAGPSSDALLDEIAGRFATRI